MQPASGFQNEGTLDHCALPVFLATADCGGVFRRSKNAISAGTAPRPSNKRREVSSETPKRIQMVGSKQETNIYTNGSDSDRWQSDDATHPHMTNRPVIVTAILRLTTSAMIPRVTILTMAPAEVADATSELVHELNRRPVGSALSNSGRIDGTKSITSKLYALGRNAIPSLVISIRLSLSTAIEFISAPY